MKQRPKTVPAQIMGTKLVRRHPANPLLTPADAPFPCSLLFNAGVAKFLGRYVMVFRNEYGPKDANDFMERLAGSKPCFDGTDLGIAYSDDGVRWEIQEKPCISLEKARQLIAPLIPGKDPQTELSRFYDPRLTVLEGRLYMCFAVDTAHGLRGGLAVTDNCEQWEVLSISVPDNRNMALFPEKIGSYYYRFERPVNTSGALALSDDQAMMWLSRSPDLRHWGFGQHVLSTDEIAFANSKMGPGAPPVRTPRGWLTTFHAVWRDDTRGKNGWERKWPKTYCAGIMLLDAEEPWKVIGRCAQPILVPEAWYETGGVRPDGTDFCGFRNDVVFPGGMILEDTGEVKIYYGSADTFECLATAGVDELIAACLGDQLSNTAN